MTRQGVSMTREEHKKLVYISDVPMALPPGAPRPLFSQIPLISTSIQLVLS